MADRRTNRRPVHFSRSCETATPARRSLETCFRMEFAPIRRSLSSSENCKPTSATPPSATKGSGSSGHRRCVPLLPKTSKRCCAFVGQAGHEVFKLLGSLWVVIRDHAFPASFHAEWMTDLVRVVERDYMQHGAWIAIRSLCMLHADTALDVLRLLPVQADDPRLSIAGFMLGVLRAGPITEPRDRAIRETEAFFNGHVDARFRGVIAHSWVATVRERALTQDELDALFARAGNSPEDRNTVMSVVCHLLSLFPDVYGDSAGVPAVDRFASVPVDFGRCQTCCRLRSSSNPALHCRQPGRSGGWLQLVAGNSAGEPGPHRIVAEHRHRALQHLEKKSRAVHAYLRGPLRERSGNAARPDAPGTAAAAPQ